MTVTVAAATLGLALPAGAAAVTTPVFSPMPAAYQGVALTRAGSDTYRMQAAANQVTVTGTTTSAGNGTRAAFWPTGQARVAKQQVCATWTSQQGPIVQQGVALRIRTVRGVTRAITVTKNIFSGDVTVPGTWIFNVHVWKTSWTEPYEIVKGFDLESAFAVNDVPKPLPWRICARVQGRLLRFEAWVVGSPVPAWGDAAHGGDVTLPKGWAYAGQAGWYAGHLGAGDSATFGGLYAGKATSVLPAS